MDGMSNIMMEIATSNIQCGTKSRSKSAVSTTWLGTQ